MNVSFVSAVGKPPCYVFDMDELPDPSWYPANGQSDDVVPGEEYVKLCVLNLRQDTSTNPPTQRFATSIGSAITRWIKLFVIVVYVPSKTENGAAQGEFLFKILPKIPNLANSLLDWNGFFWDSGDYLPVGCGYTTWSSQEQAVTIDLAGTGYMIDSRQVPTFCQLDYGSGSGHSFGHVDLDSSSTNPPASKKFILTPPQGGSTAYITWDFPGQTNPSVSCDGTYVWLNDWALIGKGRIRIVRTINIQNGYSILQRWENAGGGFVKDTFRALTLETAPRFDSTNRFAGMSYRVPAYLPTGTWQTSWGGASWPAPASDWGWVLANAQYPNPTPPGVAISDATTLWTEFYLQLKAPGAPDTDGHFAFDRITLYNCGSSGATSNTNYPNLPSNSYTPYSNGASTPTVTTAADVNQVRVFLNGNQRWISSSPCTNVQSVMAGTAVRNITLYRKVCTPPAQIWDFTHDCIQGVPGGKVPTSSTSQSPYFDFTPCLSGTYRPENGALVCSECEPGKYQDGAGTTTCKACPVGKSQPLSGKTSCNDCEYNLYQDQTGQSTCKPCDTGKLTFYKGTTQSSNCKDCWPGTYGVPNTPNSGGCRAAPIGQYCPSYKMTACTLCQAGKFQDSGTKDIRSCMSCLSGYVSSQGATVCTQCDAGKYQSSASTCQTCSTNLWSKAGATTCSSCPIGTYWTSSTSCAQCAAGQYLDTSGTTPACQACDAGKWSVSGSASSASCKPCRPGEYIDPSKGCQPCAAGKKASLTGATVTCVACDDGMISSSNSTSCTACPSGTIPSADAKTCVNCPAGQTSDAGSKSCHSCTAGRYSNAETGYQCVSCPSGTSSSSGASLCTLCGAGNYQPSIGATSCIPCAQGTYSNILGRTEVCDACPNGSTAASTGASICSRCASGQSSTSDRMSCLT